MNSLIITLALLSSTLTQLQTKLAEVPPVYASTWDKETIVAYIKEKSAQYHIDPIIPIVIVENESQYNRKAKGDGGLAHGLAQIRSDFHPEVSLEQAEDPQFAIDFLITNLAAGHTSWWSTYPIARR